MNGQGQQREMTDVTQGNRRSMSGRNLAMSQEGVVENWFIVMRFLCFYT